MRILLASVLAVMLAYPAAAADPSRTSGTTIFSQYLVETGAKPAGPTSFKAKPGGGSRLTKGDCCARVNNQCVTICNKNFCSGVGDCITNPN